MNIRKTILQQYLDKLNIQHDISPNLDNLKFILSKHLCTFPFGNVNSFIGEPVSLDLDDLALKLIEQNREGYCLEQSSLTAEVLNELGYEAFNLLARVYYQDTPVEAPIRTHLVTVVKLDQQLFLFDPSFGGMTPTQVLSLSLIDEIQNTSHENFRFIAINDTGLLDSAVTDMKIMLQAFVKDQWINIYALNPEQKNAKLDAMIANWFISTSPQSLFTQDLIFSIINDQGRVNFRNGKLVIYGENHIEKKQLVTLEEIKEVMTQIFKIDIENIDFDRVMAKLKLDLP